MRESVTRRVTPEGNLNNRSTSFLVQPELTSGFFSDQVLLVGQGRSFSCDVAACSYDLMLKLLLDSLSDSDFAIFLAVVWQKGIFVLL